MVVKTLIGLIEEWLSIRLNVSSYVSSIWIVGKNDQRINREMQHWDCWQIVNLPKGNHPFGVPRCLGGCRRR